MYGTRDAPHIWAEVVRSTLDRLPARCLPQLGEGRDRRAKTAIELLGASVSRFANKATSYSIYPSLFIDMTARRDDGQFWDLDERANREDAR